MGETPPTTRSLVLITLAAAWLGWGFDVFDGLLFSYVSKPVLKALLEKPTDETLNSYLALLTSLFLVGWAIGGILFGRVTDRLGRTRTLMLTMVLYAGATALCAASPNLPFFIGCRVLASLGIGGEWAAGAALVAEVVSDRWRPLSGAILFTASPMGMFVAGKVKYHVVQGVFAQNENGWRYAFLLGIVPALFAFAIRWFVEEPAKWQEHKREPATLGELFAPGLRRRTLTGLAIASVALIGWWGILAFVPSMTAEWCTRAGLGDAAAREAQDWGNTVFIAGSLLGTLVVVPFAMFVGRRATFAGYFLTAIAAVSVAFGGDLLGLGLSLDGKIRALFGVGFAVFGVFGLFPFWLPELFPTRLRGTGSGFCYNTGRLVTAVGVLFVGEIQKLVSLERALLAVGGVYVIGLVLLPLAIETKDQAFE